MKTKSELTKEKILLSAKKVFSEKGFHGSTTKEIAESAGVSEGSLFRYFKTKKELLTSIIIPSVVKTAEKIIKEDETNNLEAIIGKLIMSRLEIAKDIFPILKLVMFENSLDQELKQSLLKEIFIPLITQIEVVFKEKQAKGYIKDIDTFFMSRMLACMIFGFISLNEISQGLLFKKNLASPESDLPEVVEKSVDIYLNGITKKEPELITIFPEFFI